MKTAILFLLFTGITIYGQQYNPQNFNYIGKPLKEFISTYGVPDDITTSGSDDPIVLVYSDKHVIVNLNKSNKIMFMNFVYFYDESKVIKVFSKLLSTALSNGYKVVSLEKRGDTEMTLLERDDQILMISKNIKGNGFEEIVACGYTLKSYFLGGKQ